MQPKNRLQEQLLNTKPYLTCYHPSEVIDWQENKLGLDWVKIRQTSQERPNPFSLPLDKVTWTIITQNEVLKYCTYVEYNRQGNISAIILPNGKKVNPDGYKVPLENAIEHGLGECPVVCKKLPTNIWVGNQACPKLLEHMALDNIKYDSASVATYVQRTYRPFQNPDNDLGDTYTEDSEQEQMLSGNPYILKVDKFEFNEMSGSSITVLMNVLKEIEKEITDIITLGTVPNTSKSASVQSGIAKKWDLYREEMFLRSFGKVIVDLYQRILKLVARSMGFSTDISVLGLDSFELNLSDILIDSAIYMKQADEYLTPTSKRLFARQLAVSLNKNASPQQLAQIDKEIKKLFIQNAQPIVSNESQDSIPDT